MKPEYQEYLQSDHWRGLRAVVMERDNHKCCHCGNPGYIAHHKYYRDHYHDSLPQDLITLCGPCHEIVHNIRRDSNGNVTHVKQMPHISEMIPKKSQVRKRSLKSRRRSRRNRSKMSHAQRVYLDYKKRGYF